MYFEDGFPLFQVGKFYMYLPVEPSGAHQGTVENIGTVGCCKDDHTGIAGKTIHFGKQLVQGIFPFVVGSGHGIFPPGPANGINFIDKDNAGSFFFGLFEKVAYPGGPDPHEHLNKIRSRNTEERDFSFPRYRFGKQCFTCSGRANQQCAFRNFTTQLGIFFRTFQKVDDLLDLHLGLFKSGNILKVNRNTGALIK